MYVEILIFFFNNRVSLPYIIYVRALVVVVVVFIRKACCPPKALSGNRDCRNRPGPWAS